MRTIASWWLTAVIVIIFAAAYIRFSFGGNPYPAWTAFVFHSRTGAALCAVLVLNIIAANIRIVRMRFSKRIITPEYIRHLDIHAEIPISDSETMQRVMESDNSLLPQERLEGQSLRRVTGRYSFLPGTVFRFGFVLTLISLFWSAHARKTYETSLHSGEKKEIHGVTMELAAIDVDLPSDFLQVGDESMFSLADVAAKLSFDGKLYRITSEFPARVKGNYIRIRHIGYTQELAVAVNNARKNLRQDIDVLPPGKTDIIPLQIGDVYLVISLAPERTITKGLVTGRQYNLVDPAYRISVRKGKGSGNTVEKILRPESTGIVGPALIHLGKHNLYVKLEVVSDPSLLFIYCGVLLAIAGSIAMLSRFFWYERECAAVVHNNVLFVGCRDEFFKKWGIARFQRWREALYA